jgi:hypothetical protein
LPSMTEENETACIYVLNRHQIKYQAKAPKSRATAKKPPMTLISSLTILYFRICRYLEAMANTRHRL